MKFKCSIESKMAHRERCIAFFKHCYSQTSCNPLRRERPLPYPLPDSPHQFQDTPGDWNILRQLLVDTVFFKNVALSNGNHFLGIFDHFIWDMEATRPAEFDGCWRDRTSIGPVLESETIQCRTVRQLKDIILGPGTIDQLHITGLSFTVKNTLERIFGLHLRQYEERLRPFGLG